MNVHANETKTSIIGYNYDFAFYVLYKLEERILVSWGGYTPDMMATSILTGIFVLNFYLDGYFILRLIDNNYRDSSRFFLYLTIVLFSLVLVFNCRRFISKDRCLAIIKKYSKERKEDKHFYAFIVGLFAVLPFFLVFVDIFARP